METEIKHLQTRLFLSGMKVKKVSVCFKDYLQQLPVSTISLNEKEKIQDFSFKNPCFPLEEICGISKMSLVLKIRLPAG